MVKKYETIKRIYDEEKIKPRFVWQERYKLGIPPIDEQHSKIVDIINRVDAAVKSGKRDSRLILEIIGELQAYVQDHLKYEEKLFHAAGYPKIKAHKEEHQEFIEMVETYKDKFQNDVFDLNAALNFLIDWFVKHTQQSDREFVVYYLEKKKEI